MVLIEVVGSLIPLASVAEVERLGRETTAVGRRIYKVFHELVVSSQTIIVHILIAVDAVRRERVAVVVARSDTVPCLTGLLEVADVLVAQLEVAAYPCQSTIVRARTSACAVNIAVGVGLMIGTVEYKAVADEVGRKVDASVPSVVRAERTGQFNVRNCRRSLSGKRNATAKSTVAIGRSTNTALYLGAAQQRGIAIHICPEHRLVLGGVKRHTVDSDVYTATTGTTHTHIRCTSAHTVLAPCQHTGCTAE